MEKIFKMIVEGEFVEAAKALEQEANSFGFYREAADLMSRITAECASNSDAEKSFYDFACQWVSCLLKMKQQGKVDGRNEACTDLGEKLVVELRENWFQDELYHELCTWHRTVLQQASILPFMIIDSIYGKPEFADTADWYKMPLI